MKRIAFAVAVTLVLTLVGALPAAARPVAAFTYGATVAGPTFQSTGSCDPAPCRYQWRYYRTTSYDRLGSTMGEGETLVYQLPAGTWAVVLKVTDGSRAHGYSTATQYITA